MFLQLVFTVSENPGNSLRISCVKTWHQGRAPSILSLWVECSTFDTKLQTPTSPSGRKVWEVWGLLAERAPSPTAQRPASQQDLPPPLHLADSADKVRAPTSSSLRVKRRAEEEELLQQPRSGPGQACPCRESCRRCTHAARSLEAG